MRPLRLAAAFTVLGSIVFGSAQPTIGADRPDGKSIPFRNIDKTEIANTARTIWQGLEPDWSKKKLRRAIRQDTYYAFVDLADDGRPFLFLMIGDVGWCGTAGCLYYILRPAAKGYEVICNAQMGDFSPHYPGTGPHVLPEKTNGYHNLDTGKNGLLVWRVSQAYDSGDLCEEPNPAP